MDDREEVDGDHRGREGGKKVYCVIVEPATPFSSGTQQGIDEQATDRSQRCAYGSAES